MKKEHFSLICSELCNLKMHKAKMTPLQGERDRVTIIVEDFNTTPNKYRDHYIFTDTISRQNISKIGRDLNNMKTWLGNLT